MPPNAHTTIWIKKETRAGTVDVVGKVTTGRGRATAVLGAFKDGIVQIVKQPPYPGSLNVILRRPLRLQRSAANLFDNGRRMLWPAWFNGTPVWIYRWRTCPLHIVELFSTTSLRQRFGLEDGDQLTLTLDREQIGVLTSWERVAWAILWSGRQDWHYSKSKYAGFCMMLCVERRHPIRGTSKVLKEAIRRIPYLSSAVRWTTRKVRTQSYHFSRMKTDQCSDDARLIRNIQNVLNFTKTSESIYSARQFPAGYHTLHLGGRTLRGQRDPYYRLAQVPFAFQGKSVLALGCNQGGMIHAIADKLKWAVGVDFDPRIINAANRINQAIGSNNTHFYVFDLDKDPLELISDFMPDQCADICFLLSVCMWLKNWRRVIDFAQSKSSFMLFETNGTQQQQRKQVDYLKRKYHKVKLLSGSSEDDPQQKNRKLLFLTEPICADGKQSKSEMSGCFRIARRPV